MPQKSKSNGKGNVYMVMSVHDVGIWPLAHFCCLLFLKYVMY